MCPACVASAAWVAAGVTSTGGFSAVVVKLLRSKPKTHKSPSDTDTDTDKDKTRKEQ
jgi:hypothetical protein